MAEAHRDEYPFAREEVHGDAQPQPSLTTVHEQRGSATSSSWHHSFVLCMHAFLPGMYAYSTFVRKHPPMRDAPRILMVENDPIQCDLFYQILQRNVPTALVTTASTGADTRTMYQPDGTDLLMLDQRLPSISGSRWLRALRAQEVLTPTILMAAMIDRANIPCHPHTYYLPKPMPIATLLGTVQLALASSALVAGS